MNNIIPLKEIAKYSEDKIDIKLLDKTNYITTDNMLQNKLGVEEATFMPPQEANVTQYKKGDILIANIRPYLKKIWYTSQDGGNSADVLTIQVDDNFDSKFVYYALFRDDFFEHVMKGAKGTKMPRGDKNQIMEFIIPNFDKTTQQKIASVFSSLDKKIEINNKINQELEIMAKTLYDYWFVQFDFPNEEGKPYKSSGGEMVYSEELKREIPEGWKVANLKNNYLTQILKPKIDKFECEKIYLATADVQDKKINFQAEKITYDDRPSRANMQPIKNSIWFAKMKNSKKVLFFADYSKEFLENFILSTGFMGLECKDYALEYLWGFIDNSYFEMNKDRLASGATQEAINNEDLAFIKIIIPSDNVLKNYNLKVKSIYQKIYNNQIQNQELSKLRDWLLPMLMNGQVKVK